MGFQVYWISYGWIMTANILLHAIYHLTRADHTLEKDGGKSTDKI